MPPFSSGTFHWRHICTGRELPVPPTLLGASPQSAAAVSIKPFIFKLRRGVIIGLRFRIIFQAPGLEAMPASQVVLGSKTTFPLALSYPCYISTNVCYMKLYACNMAEKTCNGRMIPLSPQVDKFVSGLISHVFMNKEFRGRSNYTGCRGSRQQVTALWQMTS